MTQKIIVKSKHISNNTLSNLETRDVALWIRGLDLNNGQLNLISNFISLPWRLVMLEGQHEDLCDLLEQSSQVEDSLSRKRGLIQLINSDPSRIELPPRCLPVYLLDGQKGVSQFEKNLGRMNMLDNFLRSGVREVIIISGGEKLIPEPFEETWLAGFRANLTIGTDKLSAESEIEDWLENNKEIQVATLIQLSPIELIQDILTEYNRIFPEEKHIIRMRDNRGEVHKVDITSADEIERPLLESFLLIEERNLTTLSPSELTENEFVEFFKNPEQSWRPYAANLPWLRESGAKEVLRKCLQNLELEGADENCIAYIASEAGAGGTTFARALAWSFAREGYPVLIAKSYPFNPEALPVFNYLMHVHRIFIDQLDKIDRNEIRHETSKDNTKKGIAEHEHHYETPWIIVFDTLHWVNRDAELTEFRNMLSQYGRPVCILVVTGSSLGLSFRGNPIYKKVAELHHTISMTEARNLGQHLNEYLHYYGKERSETQWDRFYEEHTLKCAGGIASFWVTLSFWIQGQYDLSESIQDWIYRTFSEQDDDPAIQYAILLIAAMSSERFPLPQSLLPKSKDQWPVWVHLEDRANTLSRLGLTQVEALGERAWALIHDILGRLLINAFYYDFTKREAMGFSDAVNPEHLRFQILRRLSTNKLLGERSYISIGEDFATEIFKIDPDHGKNSFSLFWREVLEALDEMPQPLRDNSRLFRHHTSISRRRISKLESMAYYIEDSDRIQLLEKAIYDIKYALNEITFRSGSETDLNLLNSLSHAYFDLSEVYSRLGVPEIQIENLKELANEAARRAYRESPNNSFVMETYIQNLLRNAMYTPTKAIENCLEALGILYSALSNEYYRTSHLIRLSDQALDLLVQQTPSECLTPTPKNSIDVLVQTWKILANGRQQSSEWSLADVSLENQKIALEYLSNPVGRGNLQILRLRFDLLCNCFPYSFEEQIDVLEPLYLSNIWIAPQTQLEYAILLFQVGRSNPGEKIFRSLRRLWRESEHFVHVPERLRWLRNVGKEPLIVHATIGSELDTRPFAIVREFGNARVPIRPEEHGLINPSPGLTFSCYVSFTINGPFLRPLSSKPPQLGS